MSDEYNLDFLQLYVYTGLWNSIFLAIFAIFNLSKLMKHATRCVEEIFSLFTAVTFFVEAYRHIKSTYDVDFLNLPAVAHGSGDHYDPSISNQTQTIESRPLRLLTSNPNQSTLAPAILNSCPEIITNHRDKFLLYLMFVFMTTWFSTSLYKLKNSPFFTVHLREYFADFALPVGVIIATLINFIYFKDVGLEPISLVNYSSPVGSNLLKSNFKFYEFSNQDISPFNKKLLLISAILGFCLSLLFFMDQGFAGQLTNSPDNKLSKPGGSHYDLFLVSFINLILSLFGLPWIHGALPHSPLHVRALAKVEEQVIDGHVSEEVVSIYEQRISSFISHLLIFASINFMHNGPKCCKNQK